MRWLPRLRIVLARRPWIRWLFVVATAASAAVMVAGALADVRRARDAWGQTRDVLVAIRPLAPGDRLTDAVEVRSLPVAAVPVSAVHDAPAGATAVQRIEVGETVVAADLATRPGPLALLPDGWLAITITDVGDVAWLRPGDAATILADGHVLAGRAIVLSSSDADVLVGVAVADGPRVADAASRHVAVIALTSLSG